MSTYEIIAVVFGLISVYLTTSQNIWSWPTGLVSVVAFGLLFFDIKLYADVILQAFFFVTGLLGWYWWKFGGKNKTELQVKLLKSVSRWWIFLSIIPCLALMGWLLSNYTDASLPYWDSFISVVSIFAQLLLTKKIFENWILWIAVDIVAIGVYSFKEVYLTTGLYVIFLCLATVGLIKWYRSWQQQKKITIA